MQQKIILGYSGGLDTSIMIHWLLENYNCEVITVTCNLGQGLDEIQGIKQKAITSGASKAYILDVQNEFITEYLWKLVKSGAKYENHYLLGTISRPLIAKKLVEIAKLENGTAICHGATGKGNDQVRFELAIKAFDSKINIIAPWRKWAISSRSEAIEFAKQRSIPITATKEVPYSIDKNIWYVSHEGGDLEEIQSEHNANFYEMCSKLEETENFPEFIDIEFHQGIPVALNGINLSPILILEELNKLGSKHGIGVIDLIENRLIGMKSRGVYETPGGTILYSAHEKLESICLDKMLIQMKHKLSMDYAKIIYDGFWFTPIREALDSFFDYTQQNVSGIIKLKLYKGHCIFAGCESNKSLFNKNFATFEKDECYNQSEAEGFINLLGLPIKIQTMLNENNFSINKTMLREQFKA
ncbi:argininosuccinate synthase [Pigmentibacter sp. JX0631]|uniref:argininosuccinate synthase n=1 Tax=Pigmentibacter sp. JX0631 TaxID=2976982 RepID=UPI002469209A|nr:argininosuccinate synthase [Pigmentibacter sp. JX0631]WGL59690.1 argininosuccinate synthase [Pigmentibacter sp. JX0631]